SPSAACVDAHTYSIELSAPSRTTWKWTATLPRYVEPSHWMVSLVPDSREHAVMLWRSAQYGATTPLGSAGSGMFWFTNAADSGGMNAKNPLVDTRNGEAGAP